MNIVADTNIFLAIALNEPERARIVEVTSGVTVVSPEVLPYEIGNALSAMIKRRQVSKSEALAAESAANLIPGRLVRIEIQAALQLAIEHGIYAYDAYFLHCAKSLSSPLLTLDKGMKRIAEKLEIELLE